MKIFKVKERDKGRDKERVKREWIKRDHEEEQSRIRLYRNRDTKGVTIKKTACKVASYLGTSPW